MNKIFFYKLAHKILPNSIKDLIVKFTILKNKIKTKKSWENLKDVFSEFYPLQGLNKFQIKNQNQFNVFEKNLKIDDILYIFRNNEKKYSDVKDYWEVSRMQFLPLLALNNEIEKVSNIFSIWIKSKNYRKWGNAMESSIRAINFSISYQLIQNKLEKSIQKEWEDEILKHGFYVWNNLEKMPQNSNNHYLTDLLGLLWVGENFKKSEFGQNWIEFAKIELEKEIDKQVYSDGFDYEGSTNYHILVTEILLLSKIISMKCDFNFSKAFDEKLIKMLETIDLFSFLNGKHVNIGDNDSGKILWFDWNCPKDSVIPLLSLAQNVFPELIFPNLKISKASNLWKLFFEKSVLAEFSTKNKIMEMKNINALIAENEKDKIIFWSGIVKKEPLFAEHKHCDIFNIILELDGNPIFIDSGSFRYNRNLSEREYYVQEEAHNTIKFSEKQREMNGFFHKKDRNLSLEKFYFNDYFFNGRMIFGQKFWERSIDFGNWNSIKVIDIINQKGILNFVTNPQIEIFQKDNKNVIFTIDSKKYLFTSTEKILVRKHFVSFEYGKRIETSRLEICITQRNVCEIKKISL